MEGTQDILDKGVFHRDLKCENILIQEGPGTGFRVRIVDFGCGSEVKSVYKTYYSGEKLVLYFFVTLSLDSRVVV